VSHTVLIVDDSLTVRMDLAEAFDAAGFRTVLCSSADECRAALARETVALVILDVVLPDADGLALLKEIRSTLAPTCPVLLLSTEAEVRDRVKGLETGADDYVGKPYDVGYVIARARALLARNRKSTTPRSAVVLVIDDSTTFREELRDALEGAAYEVVTAETGEDGLRLAANLRPAAVLVDSVMPGIDGGTVIRRIRLDAALRGTPCVLMTASEDRGAELGALDAGADAFVRKEDLELVIARLGAVLRTTSSTHDERESLLGPKRILTVDDSLTYSNELAAVLRNEGYDVIQARSGEEALELLAAQPVDCILLDLVMPGLDGLETCRRIKAAPSMRDIPLVMLTANEERGAMIAGLSTGAEDFISKSNDFEVLKARVRAQLRRRQFEDEHREIREKLLRSELEATEARAARELAETRARLVEELERKHAELAHAYDELKSAQSRLVQAAKMASLGELVAGVAHEINNPLAFVTSHLDTVERSMTKLEARLDPSAREATTEQRERAKHRLREMGSGLARIRDLVLKLRTFSRLDEGERKTVNIEECVQSLLTILGHRLRGRIEVVTLFGEPSVLDCYPGPLNQAMMNLVSNAIDAISGPGTITITAGANGNAYVIRIADTGSGIPEEHRERVFDPFFTTKPVGEGTGLGLSITYSIVKKHGGTLELSSGETGGTVAEIRLPLSQSAPPPAKRA
jgi:two-component system NtrC family sensor kinase